MFYLIAATGKNRELGSKGGLVWHLPGDLQYFKKVTMGYPVFMGYNTFKSLPKMLPGRKHYVLSFERGDLPEEVEVVTDLNEFVDAHKDSSEVIFVIGGASVYAQMLPHCKKLFLTEIDTTSDAADVFFPDFNKSLYERKVVGKGADNGINYEFVEYTKK